MNAEVINVRENEVELFLKGWSDSIGGIPFPRCAICRGPVESATLDADPDRDEYVIKTGCHGDRLYIHLPLWFAHQVASRLKVHREMSQDPNSVKWTLPEVYTGLYESRIEGVLHFDMLQFLASQIEQKTEAQAEVQRDLEAKQQFIEEFEHAAKTEHIKTVYYQA